MAKNNSKNLLLIAAAAIAGWYFWTRSATLNSLQFIPTGIGVQGAAVNLTIGVQNPTANPLTLSSLIGSLSISGSPVGNVSDFTPVVIQPNSQTNINVLITPNVFGIAAGAINMIDGNEGESGLNATLSGTANVNGIPLPVNIAFS